MEFDKITTEYAQWIYEIFRQAVVIKDGHIKEIVKDDGD